MAYRLMAVDVDGTLLNSSGILTKKTEEAIKCGLKKGLIFVISTGRPAEAVQSIVEKLNEDLPIIAYNGALVVLGKSGDVLYKCTMKPKDAKTIFDLGEEFDTNIVLWVDGKLYANKLNDLVYEYSKITGVSPILIEDIEEVVSKEVLKILWYDKIEAVEEYKKRIDEHFAGSKDISDNEQLKQNLYEIRDRINYHTSQPYFLEFVDRNASKAKAMEKLGEHFGIKREEMIAVGDGYNDLSMIEFAGLGIAMGNACGEIKSKADYVTLSNDEDGLANVINKFVLGKD